jgi:flagellar hook-basal body complex protein FliE
MTDDLIQRLRAAHDMMATYTARSTVGADNWNYALHGLSCGDGKAVVEVLQEAIDQLVALQRERDSYSRSLIEQSKVLGEVYSRAESAEAALVRLRAQLREAQGHAGE